MIEKINDDIIKFTPVGRTAQQITMPSANTNVIAITEVLNSALEIIIDLLFGFKSYMILEPEEFGAGYFYRSKNYVLLEADSSEKGYKVIKHGVSMKSSSKCKIYDIIMDIVCENVLIENPNMLQLIEEYRDLDRYGLKDFSLSTKLTKDPGDYTNANAYNVKLAYQTEKFTGYLPKAGDTIYYVKSIEPEYTIASEATIENIDKPYYYAMIQTILDIFNLSRPKARKLI